MLSKISFSGLGKSGIQQSSQHLLAPCGITNSDSNKDGSLKVRSFSVKVKSLQKSQYPPLSTDPREAVGHCARILTSTQIFDGNYPSSATGGVSVPSITLTASTITAFVIQPFVPTTIDHYFSQVGAGTLDPVQSASHTFPPPTISPSFSGTQISLLPTYTPTGSLKTLFGPTFTAAPSAVVGSGWNNQNDNDPAYVYVPPLFVQLPLLLLTYTS